MMKIKYILIYIILFLGPNVLYNLGIPFGRGGIITKILPTFFPVLSYIIYLIWSHNKVLKNTIAKRKNIKVLLLLLFIFIINMYIGNGGGMTIVNTFIFTLLLSLIIDNRDSNAVYQIIMRFYILTCIVAVLEIFVGRHVFDLDPVLFAIDPCYNPIRATCFQGHSLSNCLIIDTIMLFIAFSSLKIKSKMTYLFLGMVAILAFGARSSLLLWVGLIPLLLLNILFGNRYSMRNKIFALITLLIAVFSAFWLLINTPLGTRIMQHSEFDTSAEIRIRSLNAIYYMNTNEFLWGYPNEKTEYLYDMINVNALENFYIIWLLKFGLIISVFILWTMFYILFKSMEGYKKSHKIVIIIAFLLVASTNNSLGTGGIFLLVFYLCGIAFKNKYSNERANKIKKKDYDSQNHPLLLVRSK